MTLSTGNTVGICLHPQTNYADGNNLYGFVGVTLFDTHTEIFGPNVARDELVATFTLGAGGSFRVSTKLAIDVELEGYYNEQSFTAIGVSAGLRYLF